MAYNYKLLIKYSQIFRINHFGFNNKIKEKRLLYTPTFLGMDKFEMRRKKVQASFEGKDANFKELMKYNEKEKNFHIYEYDFKHMIYLCQKDSTELELVMKMAKRYLSQQPYKIEGFSFGPELMRLFYLLNAPLEAKEAITDEDIQILFTESSSYLIYMTLLYNTGLYEDVVHQYNELTKKFFRHTSPKTFTNLVLASLYQMNSPKSLENALDLVDKIENSGIGSRALDARFLSFVSMLALKQGNAPLAYELISKASNMNYVLRNIKVKVLLELGRVKDILSILRASAEATSLRKTRDENEDLLILKETLTLAEEALKGQAGDEALAELASIKWSLAKNSLILNETLKEALCKPMDGSDSPRSKGRKNRRMEFAAALQRGSKR